MSVVTADLMSRARVGDSDAFQEMTEPYRRGLHTWGGNFGSGALQNERPRATATRGVTSTFRPFAGANSHRPGSS